MRACVFCQGLGEPLCGVWEHGATSEEGRRPAQQRHGIPVLGEKPGGQCQGPGGGVGS